MTDAAERRLTNAPSLALRAGVLTTKSWCVNT
jgi:hypothetical protein